MSKPRRHVRKGDNFFGVLRQTIKRAFKHKRSCKSRKRLKDALLGKEGHGMKDISDHMERSVTIRF